MGVSLDKMGSIETHFPSCNALHRRTNRVRGGGYDVCVLPFEAGGPSLPMQNLWSQRSWICHPISKNILSGHEWVQICGNIAQAKYILNHVVAKRLHQSLI